MVAVGKHNFIGIDPDQAIYRTFSMYWFLDLLQSGENGLRNPSKWEDPFENFLMSRTKVATGVPGEFADLSNLAEDWYGQCWTTNCDTDAMWRIYSPKKEGIQVKTTVRKLFDNLCQVPVWSPRAQFFAGKVAYKSPTAIKSLMKKLTFTSVISGGQGDGFAELLCVKRKAFAHEREVRLLYQDNSHQAGGRRGANHTMRYPLDANAVFDAILLDPRLTDRQAALRRRKLKSAGWKGAMPKSTLYEIPAFVIPAS